MFVSVALIIGSVNFFIRILNLCKLTLPKKRTHISLLTCTLKDQGTNKDSVFVVWLFIHALWLHAHKHTGLK